MAIAAVLNGINDINGVPFRVSLIPKTNPNRPGVKLNGGIFVKSTVHETGNTDDDADAEMHRKFVTTGKGGPAQVSFHAVVDDKEIIQLLPFDEVGWHAGDGTFGIGNRTSIATETCVNAAGDWEKTLQNLIIWQRFLIQHAGLTPQDVVQHNHWSGKDCPHYMRLSNGARWREVFDQIAGGTPSEIVDRGSKALFRFFPTTGHGIGGDFKKEWEKMEAAKLAMRIIGYPITEELQETIDGWTGTVQYFERSRLEWHSEFAPAKVLYGAVGREDAIAKGIVI
jgi:N-acetylmuramoyl-L-alanine amidase